MPPPTCSKALRGGSVAKTSLKKADGIAARFGGRQVTFRIDRRDLPAFEKMLAIPAPLMLRRLLAGEWTVEGLSRVLRFAALPESALQIMRRGRYAGGHIISTDTLCALVDARGPKWVDAVLGKHPPADYVPLGAGVIGAALFGIDEAEATFDDGVPAGG